MHLQKAGQAIVYANWRRFLLVILLDFWIYSSFYSLFLVDWLLGLNWWFRSFFIVELIFFFIKKWMLSPGMFLLGIYQTSIENPKAGRRQRETIARLVNPSIYRHENWLTLLLGFIFFFNGIHSFAAWFDSSPALPLFGAFPSAEIVFIYLYVTGLISLFTGYAYFRLTPYAYYLGLAIMLMTVVSTIMSWEQWLQVVEELGLGEETEFMRTFLPGTTIGISFLVLVAVAVSKKYLVLDNSAAPGSYYYAGYNLTLLSVLLVLVLGKFAFYFGNEKYANPDTSVDFREMVTDPSGLMDMEQQRFVARYHSLLSDDHDIDYRVLIIDQSVDLDLFSARRFGELSVGKYSKTGRGILLVLDTSSDKVRLEISAALEGVYTDAFVAYIQQRQMVYFFRSGRVADGILATTELIISRAQDAEEKLEFDPVTMPSFTTGGGAKTSAHLNQSKSEILPNNDAEQVDAGNSPLDTIHAYIDAMRVRNSRPDLGLYTDETKSMLAGWTVTPAQIDNIVRSFSQCPDYSTKQNGNYAVVRYPPEKRQCSPWFLRFQDREWRLDLTVMQNGIQFNHKNQWHFAKGINNAYMFAFADWRIDRHGFPHSPR